MLAVGRRDHLPEAALRAAEHPWQQVHAPRVQVEAAPRGRPLAAHEDLASVGREGRRADLLGLGPGLESQLGLGLGLHLGLELGLRRGLDLDAQQYLHAGHVHGLHLRVVLAVDAEEVHHLGSR